MTALMVAINDAGLMDLSKTSEAHEAATRIIEHGSDLPEDLQDQEFMELSFRVFSDPTNWGISDPAWIDFCINWSEA